jgi:hypothetical protein
MLCGSVSWGIDTQVCTQCGIAPVPDFASAAAAGAATATAVPETKASNSRRVGPVGMVLLLASTGVSWYETSWTHLGALPSSSWWQET